MKSSLVLSCICAVGLAHAADLYVDKDNPSAADTNPGTESAPFKSIQAAVAYAATSDSGYVFADGDTIRVKPARYDNGGYVDGNGLTNRVYITKPVRLVATGGRDSTSIVGAWHSASSAYGSAAVRCVRVSSGGSGTIIRGFTITKGSTLSGTVDVDDGNYAGGVLATAGAPVYVVECAVTDCRGRRGAALSRATAVRSYFSGNMTGYTWGSVGSNANFLNCIFFGNGSSGTPTSYGRAVNCTFVANNRTGASDTYVDNSLFVSPNNDFLWDCVAGRTNNLVTTKDNGTYQIMSSATCDCRLLPTSAAIGAGLASHLTKITLPTELEGERYRDYYGAAIPTSGAINVGAVQSVGNPQGGGMYFDFPAAEVDGMSVPAVSGMYVFGETYPTQHVVRPYVASGSHLFCLRIEPRLGGLDGLYPDLQDRFFLTPSPNAKTNDVYQCNTTTAVKWVDPDPTKGSDDNTGTEAAPYKTLEKAMEYARNNQRTVVYCRKGVYDEKSAGGCRLFLPNNKYCFVRAVDGPEKTFIFGESGIGCVGIPYYGAVQGFTLTRADTATGSGHAGAGGGQGSLDWLLDCVVSNNVSGSGYILSNVWLQRCLVTGNLAGTWVANSSRFSSSVVCNNESANNDYIFNGTSAYQSTIYNNGARIMGGFNCYNCIVGGSGEIRSNCGGVGNTVWGPTYATAGWTTQDPLLVDPANGDCRVLSASPTIGGGEKPTAENYAAVDVRGWRMLSTSTYEGERLHFAADGTPDAGAIQYDHPSIVSVKEGESGALMVSGVKIGVTPVAQGETVSFVVSRGSDSFHFCKGFTLNGTFVDFDDYPYGWSTNFTAKGDALAIEAVMSKVFYAAPDGLDTNDGWTRDTPKTLQGAVDRAKEYGDTVIALAGVYDQGAVRVPAGASILSRVSIPGNVTLVSDEGAEKTFIVGAPSTDETATKGCGPDAVRCVRFPESGGRIRGFTLTGGYSGLASAKEAETGPAVWATDSAYIENCVISNNTVAWRGGCYYGTYVNCAFLANKMLSGGETPALYYGGALNCFFDHNRGNYITQYCSWLVNCTFGRDNKSLSGTGTAIIWGPGSSYKTYNCLFLDGAGGGNSGNMKNCVFASDVSGNVPDLATYKNGYENVVQKPFAELGVDDTGRPLAKTSAIVDYGAKALYDAFGTQATDKTVDFDGSQRVYNAAIDVGCREFDWRPAFSTVLGKRIAVTSADPMVFEGVGTLVVADGSTLKFRVSVGQHRGRVKFRANGEGTAAVRVGDTVLEPGAGGEYSFYADANTSYDVTVAASDGDVAVSNVTLPRGGLVVVAW